MSNEDDVMFFKIAKVKAAISRVLDGCVNELPDIQFGWSGSVIEVYLSGGNYQVRNLIESHFVNSRRYKGVTITNNDTKKRISFILN
ncbi:hypothetical protein SBF1_50034 [Candidatus Desulfosporosinus infrequens]|uniref:Uncharacterized protein n=1 Tax=Candidatus Desulfosporosinus infrequens TaxID=2043169 RepID=A0A2U3LH34_9FIRM|nr:hypothetical protein SBF1_50034 [Candidatus Desulfosporosinus infrequens]